MGNFEDVVFPHIMYLLWPIESMYIDGPPADDTVIAKRYVGNDPRLKTGEVYKFKYAAYSPNKETPRKKVLYTKVPIEDLPKLMQENQPEYRKEIYVRLEEDPHSWKNVENESKS